MSLGHLLKERHRKTRMTFRHSFGMEEFDRRRFQLLRALLCAALWPNVMLLSLEHEGLWGGQIRSQSFGQ